MSNILKFLIIISLSKPVFSIDGVWSGIFDINGHGTYDFIGLISNEYTTAYTEKAKVVYSGKIRTKNDNFAWDLIMYLKDGTNFGTAEIKGKIINNNIMSGKWTTEPAKDYGNIYLVKLKENEVLDTGEIINKKWYSVGTKIKHNILINDYKILGKDENNCNYYGDIKKLNKKIYKVNIEIASCGVSDGLYVGMAHIKKINGKNNLTISATSNNFSIFLNLR